MYFSLSVERRDFSVLGGEEALLYGVLNRYWPKRCRVVFEKVTDLLLLVLRELRGNVIRLSKDEAYAAMPMKFAENPTHVHAKRSLRLWEILQFLQINLPF